ncbi:MAG TPA: DUF885 domain-containing protein [Candidatus Limnocylindrales bacterium]|nr:DUF885 domain-containing protein [Candidatus Limnocylindrales bacterium]
MTERLPGVHLPRPEPATDAGPLDDLFYGLVETRVRRLFEDNPALASQFGVHTEDHRLGDASRDAVLEEIAADRAHLSAVEALDDAGLSRAVRFERDLEVHNVRLTLFETDEVRSWERAGTAAGVIGDAVFLLFARGARPLAERLERITDRLEAVPAFVDASRSRLIGPPVRIWQEVEARYAKDLPSLFADVLATAETTLSPVALSRMRRAIDAANTCLEDYGGWLRDGLARATDDWPMGRERYDELVRLRAFGDLDTDTILRIGEEQLALSLEARRAAAREIDRDADLPTVIDRLKNDHPATFAEALDGYRDAMRRARAHIIERGVATIPHDEHVEVIETPEYLRTVMPFAAYYEPARFDDDQLALYIVTPDVDGDANAMREHYWASISNTSIHEAYPGHHLQLTMASRHPSLTRMLTDAPEFVEGWGMYSEQLMREEGFDDGPAFRAAMYTDVVWRACRIILDIRMHRGELSADEATDFLVEHTMFEPANARAEVRRYTYTPGYQLSYLLGKVLILGLREEERRRLGAGYDQRRFHDTLLRNGSLPISFHRRLLRGAGA